MIGILAASLTVAAVAGSPQYCRLVSSAQSVGHYFHELKTTGQVNPVERFLFSVILAGAKQAPVQQSHS